MIKTCHLCEGTEGRIENIRGGLSQCFNVQECKKRQQACPRRFTVHWIMDIDEVQSHEEAAKKALFIMRDPNSIATVFEVVSFPDNEKKVIDLNQEVNSQELINFLERKALYGLAEFLLQISSPIKK